MLGNGEIGRKKIGLQLFQPNLTKSMRSLGGGAGQIFSAPTSDSRVKHLPTALAWQQSEVAKEADVISDIAMILSPVAYKEGSWAWRGAKNAVRSKIWRMRKAKKLSQPVGSNPKKLKVAEFLTFASSYWPELAPFIESHGRNVAFAGPQSAIGLIGSALVTTPPTDYEELKKAYLAERKLRIRAEARVVELETEKTIRDAKLEKKRAAGRQVGKKE
jgi:hypothetical protein